MKKFLSLFAAFLFLGVTQMWGENLTKTEGFETKADGSNYQSTVTVSEAESDCGIGWSIYYGTVSTNDKISGSNSAQMRYYYNKDDRGYVQSTTPVEGLSNVAFKARVSSLDMKLTVSYSADGSEWTALATDVAFEAVGAAGVKTLNYDIPSGGKYIKFEVAEGATQPSKSNIKLIIDDVVFTYEEQGGDDPDPTAQTLYLQLNSDWAGSTTKFAAYYFKDDTDKGWSEMMTAVEGETNLMTTTIPLGYSKVIFARFKADATNPRWDEYEGEWYIWSQTKDLTIPEGKNLFTLTSGGTGKECDGVWAKYPVIPTYYVAGSMTEWADNMVEMSEGSYTFEGLAAGKYEIKVVDNNANWLGYDKLNTTASNKNVYGEGEGNIKFVLGEEGDVTVAYDGDKITVTGATIVAPTTVFTVTVPEGTEKAFIAGNFTQWSPVEMTLKEENVFTYSFAGDVADTASYKYLAGPAWKYVEINADDTEKENRGYNAADEVAKWAAVPVALKYAKVTKAPINWTGHYIISFGDSKPHMAISGSDFVAAADAPAFVEGDTISVAEGFDVEIRFSETAGAYTIKLPSEKYIKIPGSNAVNEAETAMALYLNYFKGTKQEGVQIADKNDFTSTSTRMIYKNNNNYRSYTDKIDGAYVLPTLYRLVDEAFDCQNDPFAILVNGKDVEETVAGEEFEGYQQYVAYLSLTKGDSIQLINTSCGATWLPAIEEGGMSAHFKKGLNAATIDTTGCFDLYIKMKEGDDKIFIGAGICAGDTVRYYIAGEGEGEGLGWDEEERIAAKQDTTVLNLKAGDYKLKVVAGENWLGYDKLTKVAEGLKDLDGDDHNIGFTLKEDAAVTIVYNDTVFTVTGNFYVRVPEYKDLYLVPGVWAEKDAKIAAWIYTKKEGHEMEDQWTAFFAPKAENNDTLTAKIDAEADSIVFVRFNATAEAPSWEEKDDFRWNSIAGDTIDYVGLTYTITDWYAGTWKKYEPAKFYISGIGGWAADQVKSTEDSYTFKDLEPGDYQLKVLPKGSWDEPNKGFGDLSAKNKGLYTDFSGNVCFTLKEKGDVTVTYIAGEKPTYTVSGNFYAPTLRLVPGVWAADGHRMAAWVWKTNEDKTNTISAWANDGGFFEGEGDTLTMDITLGYDSIQFVCFDKETQAPNWETGKVCNSQNTAIDFEGLTFSVTGEYSGTWEVYVPEAPAKFYVTGDSALVVDAAGLEAAKWAPNAIKSENDTLVLNLKADQYYILKVAVNGTWEGENNVKGYNELTEKTAGLEDVSDDHNIGFKLNEAGKVKVVYIAAEGENPEVFKLIGDFYVAPVVYTVVGVEPLVGYYWGDGLNATENEMTKQEDGTYKLVKEMVELAAGDYEYQVAQNHYWRGVDNSTLSITQDGKYDVTFTFNPADGTTNATADLKEHIEIDPEAIIRGTLTDWAYAEKMTLSADKKSASMTINIEDADSTYILKMFINNNAWLSNNYAFTRDNNQSANIETNWDPGMTLYADIAGEYTFTWTFETNTLEITYPALPAAKYYIAGDFTGWSKTEMTENEGIYSATIAINTLEAQGFKVVRVQGPYETWYGLQEYAAMTAENCTDWVVGESIGEAYQANIGLTPTKAGDYTFTFNATENKVSVALPTLTMANGYYLIGQYGFEVSDLASDLKFAESDTEGQFKLDVTLVKEQQIKVVEVYGDAITTWYPANENNYIVDAQHAGSTTVYFRPDGQGNDDWFEHYFYVVPTSDDPTALDNVAGEEKPVKIVRDNKVYIVKGDKIYNITGQLVR